MKKLILKGSWREMGREAGEKQRAVTRSVFQRLKIPPTVRRLLPEQHAYLLRNAPDQWSWIEGYSEGSGHLFDDVLALVSWEYAVLGTDKCTTVLGEEKGKWFLAHNEDDHPFWRGKLTQLELHPKDGVAFTGIQYAGSLPGASANINRAGLAVAMDNVALRRDRVLVGLPMSVVGCRFIQSRNWKEVMSVYRSLRVNSGMHFLVVEKSKRAMSFELFPDGKASRRVQPDFFHTNHALTKHASAGAGSPSSRRRLANLMHALPHHQKEVLACLETPIPKGGVRSNGEQGYVTLARILITPETGAMRVWD